MKENGWGPGPDDEELFELAMHPEQYRAYKSGVAKKNFEADLSKRKADKEAPIAVPVSPTPKEEVITFKPKSIKVDVNGEQYDVKISYGEETAASPAASGSTEEKAPVAAQPASMNGTKEILAPIEGNFMLTKTSSEAPLKVGEDIKEGDLIGYIEAMKVYNAIHADKSGKVVEICQSDGSHVDEDDLLIKLS
jgi:pyruvate carboxylase subunit B